jgi:hypothetical protein
MTTNIHKLSFENRENGEMDSLGAPNYLLKTERMGRWALLGAPTTPIPCLAINSNSFRCRH